MVNSGWSKKFNVKSYGCEGFKDAFRMRSFENI